MSRPSNILVRAINYDHTPVLSVELSNKSWVLAAQVALLHGGAWGRHSPFGFVIMRGE